MLKSKLRNPKIAKFLGNSIASPDSELTQLKNLQFCIDLQIHAMEELNKLMVQIKQDNDLNTKHPETGQTILDFALLSGNQDLAKALASLGCVHSQRTKPFIEQLSKLFPSEHKPKMVKDLLGTADGIEEGFQFAKKLKNVPKFINRNKFAIFTLIVGIICVCCAPLAGAYGPILLAIGIPTILFRLGIKTGKEAPASQKSEEDQHSQLESLQEDAERNLAVLKERRNLLKDPYVRSDRHSSYLEPSSIPMLFMDQETTRELAEIEAKHHLRPSATY